VAKGLKMSTISLKHAPCQAATSGLQSLFLLAPSVHYTVPTVQKKQINKFISKNIK